MITLKASISHRGVMFHVKLRGVEDFRHVRAAVACKGHTGVGKFCRNATNYTCIHCGVGRCATHMSNHFCPTKPGV